jgi:hypothetical protein
MAYSVESRGIEVETGNLDEATEMQRIVEANLVLSEKIGKPSILLLPQKIALDDAFIDKLLNISQKIHIVDLTVSSLFRKYKSGDVIVAYTGPLQQTVFDYLMLKGTTLPPVIEGCNSREACDSAGRFFIHGSGKFDQLKQYPVKLTNKQELHTQASLCLEQGSSTYARQLRQYMEECLTFNPELMAYHEERREAFLKRPDACEVALNALGIKYNGNPEKASSRGNSSKLPSSLSLFNHLKGDLHPTQSNSFSSGGGGGRK